MLMIKLCQLFFVYCTILTHSNTATGIQQADRERGYRLLKANQRDLKLFQQ